MFFLCHQNECVVINCACSCDSKWVIHLHLCVLLAQSFQEMYQRKKQCSKSFAFFQVICCCCCHTQCSKWTGHCELRWCKTIYWMKEHLLYCNVVAKNQWRCSLDVPREALHHITLEPNLSTCCLARMWSIALCSYASFLSTKIDAFHWVRVNQNSLLCKGYWILWWKRVIVSILFVVTDSALNCSFSF